MIKKLTILVICLAFALALAPAGFAAPQDSASPNFSVVIESPHAAEGLPVFNADFQIRITNLTDHELTGLSCYLTVVDLTHGMSLNMDEFGANSYQVRKIDSIPAGGDVQITIPVSIVYVGQFCFTATVISDTGEAAGSNAVPVNMLITSTLNKSLVVAIAIAMPLLLSAAAFILTKKRKVRI